MVTYSRENAEFAFSWILIDIILALVRKQHPQSPAFFLVAWRLVCTELHFEL